ncbi:glycosyltransferase [Hymenobacter sp. BT664]|uniref:Glycosyltransferase n=1 Tax=Hymenobacter montanus TaxID=2771359 RepID=A0A927BA98_9BACT|nr:glycosyltransferase [Hymenobacter montanus]MBD2766428.1 glycosyltransferase [Hymenobacter montanus]
MVAKVSIIIPNFNHAQYLSQRIESVLGQTWQDFEVILMDDCSQDTSRSIIDAYAAKDSRIRVIYNEANSGSTFKQWNKGIRLAQGDYVWIAESDDVADPRFLEALLSKLEVYPDAGLAYCDSWSIDSQGKLHGTGRYLLEELDSDLFRQDFVLPGPELVRRFMSYRNIVPNASAVVMRRSTLLAVGAAPEHLRVAGDWWFWVRYFQQTQVVFIAEPLNYFRFHVRNVRTRTEQDGTQLLETAEVLAYIKQVVEPEPRLYQRAIALLIERWLHALVYYGMPLARHRRFIQIMSAIEPGFRTRLLRHFVQFLVRNRLSGTKMLLFDKLLGRSRRTISTGKA